MSSTDEIESGIAQMTRHRLLTHVEEIELSRRVKLGDIKARHRLIESNMGLVVNIAKKYNCRTLPLGDLVQEGAIGLITATERYDPDRGYRFSTYATHWIKQAISRAIENKSRAIRTPAHVAEQINKILKAAAALSKQGVTPTIKEVANHTGLSEQKVQQYIKANMEPVSLSTLVGTDENTELQDFVLVDHHPDHNPQASLDLVADREEMDEFLRSLTERERDVMKQRVGYDDDEAKVFQEIGRRLHLSRERVRQIETKALGKLSKSASRIRQRDHNAIHGVTVQRKELAP